MLLSGAGALLTALEVANSVVRSPIGVPEGWFDACRNVLKDAQIPPPEELGLDAKELQELRDMDDDAKQEKMRKKLPAAAAGCMQELLVKAGVDWSKHMVGAGRAVHPPS